MNKKSGRVRGDGCLPLFRRTHRSLVMALVDFVLGVERRVSKATEWSVLALVEALEALVDLEITLVKRIARG